MHLTRVEISDTKRVSLLWHTRYNHDIKHATRKIKYSFLCSLMYSKTTISFVLCGFSACRTCRRYRSETWNLLVRIYLCSLIDALIAERVVCAAVLRSCPVVPPADAGAFLPGITASSCAGGSGLPAGPRFLTVVFQTQYKNSVIIFYTKLRI